VDRKKIPIPEKGDTSRIPREFGTCPRDLEPRIGDLALNPGPVLGELRFDRGALADEEDKVVLGEELRRRRLKFESL
jgi:hypothetical protein